MKFFSGNSWVVNTITVILVISILTGLNYWLTANEAKIGRGFLIPWVGNRFILEGKSPYGDDVSNKIEELAYPQPYIAEERELRFVMPLYASVIIIPFSFISDFNLARALWLSISQLFLLSSSFLILKITEVDQHDKPFFFALFLFASLWYFSFFPIVNGHTVILVFFFLLISIF